MKRGMIVLLASFLFLIPTASASLEEQMNQVQGHIADYKNRDIDAAKLIVYIDYMKNKMYEELDIEGEKAFAEAEVKKVLEKAKTKEGEKYYFGPRPPEMYHDPYMKTEGYEEGAYEKKFYTNDFTVTFTAYPFYRHDRPYYEKREIEAEAYFKIEYEIEPAEPTEKIEAGEDLKGDIEKFIADLQTFVDNDEYLKQMQAQHAEERMMKKGEPSPVPPPLPPTEEPLPPTEETAAETVPAEEELPVANASTSSGLTGNAVATTEGDEKAEEEWERLQKEFSIIKQKVASLNRQNCNELMEQALEINKEQHRRWETTYSTMLKQGTFKQCWPDQKCEQVCKPEQICWPDCKPVEHCDKDCHQECNDEWNCEEAACTTDPKTNETICPTVEPICNWKEVCKEVCTRGRCWFDQECREKCEQQERCEQQCHEEERCEDQTNGELRVEALCGKDYTDIHVNAWGPGFDYYNDINHMGHPEMEKEDCLERIRPLVNFRKAIQGSVNNDFAKWYFEEFINQDPEKLNNGGDGFKKVMQILIDNEQKIAENMRCPDIQEWPEGFEPIEITYVKGNTTRIEVWEKRIPVEGTSIKYWTTLYKYAWVPDKELLKKLILYKIEEQGVIGPSAKEAMGIRGDEGQMQIVNALAEAYGGSLDVKLELVEEGTPIITKYIQVNPDIVAGTTDSITAEEPDMSISIDFDALHNFIRYLHFTTEGDKIYGPQWVYLHAEGPGKFFGILGAMSKMWREGITIKPRHALMKAIFNIKKIVTIMTTQETAIETYEGPTMEGVPPPEKIEFKMTGDAVLEREE